MTRILGIATTVAILTACGGGGSSTDTADTDVSWEPVSYIDEGDVCFGTVDADTESTVSVVVQDCMSGNCSRAFQGSCTAVVSGTEITLTSDISWEDATGNIGCDDDCGRPATSCSLEGLAAGTYDVTFGTESLTLEVPSVENCDYY